jgi:hypothetical protein
MRKPHPVTVAVRPRGALAARPRLFAALEAAFGVVFVPWASAGMAPDAVLAFGEQPLDASGLGVPAFLVSDTPARPAATEPVRLGAAPAVDARVRGVTLTAAGLGAVLPTDGADVLAAARSGPVWTRTRGPVPVDRIRSPLPDIGSRQVLRGLLATEGAPALVALTHFLRALGEPEWRPPPLRAAIVFDDPNLRWRSYGFIDYDRLVAHADAHGYHAAMAMIPLDAGRAHRSTADLFARRPDRLSLVFHGNDHLRLELMGPPDLGSALAMTAQAVRRVARFERRTGLHVDRVMMPPHGMCSRHATRALGRLGFDALCTIHTPPWTVHPPPGRLIAGWRPGDFVGGCAVIPRVPLASSADDLALHAFLDHALVLYGHHEDLARGLGPLAEAAARVNALGDVQWMSVEQIALSGHALRTSGDRVAVRAYARRARVVAPAGARTLTVEPPEDALDPGALAGWSLGAGPLMPFDAEVALPRGPGVEVRLHGAADLEAAEVAVRRWRPWPRVRRVATETRDRALPLVTAAPPSRSG